MESVASAPTRQYLTVAKVCEKSKLIAVEKELT
jgi:hypothetical protein